MLFRSLLKAEMLGTARIDREVPTGVLVSASAVQLKGTEHWCYVESEPGVFEARQVTVGHEGLKQVLVTEGVKAGERVVVYPGDQIADAVRVKPMVISGR